jgi:malonyl CoA-acyl carrier protein transacylase
MVLQEISKVGAKISIHLGGYIVIAGEQNQLDHLLSTLPAIDKYPFQIPFHSAFHTDLLSGVPSLAHSSLGDKIFNRPNIPIVDGRGNIWSPWSTDEKELYNYTLNDQITSTYDFSKSISVSLKEFCPDHIVLLGPGNSLGAPVAQVLINHNWNELKTKTDFLNSQGSNPYIISMGLEEQKKLVL